ncbi:hypothetical protein LSAT2_002014 [Lamellibrachia satsuma]|nr:hypothetical protein LSAT2_002014 [Lamellibrachia satsuma]
MGVDTPFVGFIKSLLGTLLSLGGILLACFGIYLLITSDSAEIGGIFTKYVMPFFLTTGGSTVGLFASIWCCYKLADAIYSIIMCICLVFCTLIAVGIALVVISVKYPEVFAKGKALFFDSSHKSYGSVVSIDSSPNAPTNYGATIVGGIFLGSGIVGLIVVAVILVILVSRQRAFFNENLEEWRMRSREKSTSQGTRYQRRKNTNNSRRKHSRGGQKSYVQMHPL